MIRRRLRALLSWQVVLPIAIYVLVALLTVSVVEAFVARNEALDARNKTAAAASRRIDLLNAEILRLGNRITSDARERGRLEEAIKLLAQEVRRMGGTPVEGARGATAPFNPFVAPSSTSHPHSHSQPHSQPSHSPHPRPKPSPSPSPTPTPTCLAGVVCLPPLLRH